MFKPILKPKEAEGHILGYQPRIFGHKVNEHAADFVKGQNEKPDSFVINELVAQTTGVSEIEKKNFNDRLESEVLARLKTIEEKAFAEAYSLGLKDGRAKAFADAGAEIKKALESLASIIDAVKNLKGQLFVENEAHFIKTIFHIAKALALKEIKGDSSAILGVLKKAVENAQFDEEMTIRLNPEDNVFLETVKNESGSPFERLQKIKIETSDGITRGGCTIETNYGMVDATIEQRVEKLWMILEGKIPQTQET